jgi:hypothetical protein
MNMNKNASGTVRGFFLVLLVSALGVMGNNALAVESASMEVNFAKVDEAIEHTKAAIAAAEAGDADLTKEHAQLAIDATDELELANGAPLQRAVSRLKRTKINIKRGKPLADNIKLLNEAIPNFEALKANF